MAEWGGSRFANSLTSNASFRDRGSVWASISPSQAGSRIGCRNLLRFLPFWCGRVATSLEKRRTLAHPAVDLLGRDPGSQRASKSEGRWHKEGMQIGKKMPRRNEPQKRRPLALRR